jgi:hypothetical protein
LWVATQTGLVACVDPATGRVRAAETVTSAGAQLAGLLAADGAAGEVFGFVANDGYGALVSITPPRLCWGAAGSPARTVVSQAPWPERRIVPEPDTLRYVNQVLDPAAGILFALVPTAAAAQYGPYVLEAIDLRTGRVRTGASYRGSFFSLASGYLWVYVDPGPHKPTVLDQVSPGTLTTIRPVPMPQMTDPASVVPGPPGSVWAGAGRTLLRVSVNSGTVLARAILPAGLLLTDLAAGPGGLNVYAAAARLVKPYGAVVLEYAAGTGAPLDQFDGATLKWSAGGAWLTAVPGGVWVSFRTGMLGESGLLNARSLSPVSGFASGVDAGQSPVTGIGSIYSWAMFSASAYGGGALWVTTTGGLVACVNPAAGTVRAQETAITGQALGVFALAVDPAARELVAVIGTTSSIEVATITPPRDCWG